MQMDKRSYICAFYGPLLIGATSVINENPMFISLIKNLCKILQDTRPDCFYTSVTSLRLLKNSVNSKDTILDFVSKDINLDRVGSCGEPLANSLGEWILKFFKTKRKTIVNTYFQTETGGIHVCPKR